MGRRLPVLSYRRAYLHYPDQFRPVDLYSLNKIIYFWLVVTGLTALWDSILNSLYRTAFERKKKRKNRLEKKYPNNPHPHLQGAPAPKATQHIRTTSIKLLNPRSANLHHTDNCVYTTLDQRVVSNSNTWTTICPPVRKIIHSLKLVIYLLVQADKPWYIHLGLTWKLKWYDRA